MLFNNNIWNYECSNTLWIKGICNFALIDDWSKEVHLNISQNQCIYPCCSEQQKNPTEVVNLCQGTLLNTKETINLCFSVTQVNWLHLFKTAENMTEKGWHSVELYLAQAKVKALPIIATYQECVQPLFIDLPYHIQAWS